MSKIRVWHSSRDAYHCAFRILRLLLATETGELSLEWIRILDMFLLYPSLLHSTSMPQETKDHFRTLGIPRPSQIFIKLPSSAIIAQDLRIYQTTAATQLAARSILDADLLRKGMVRIDPAQLPEIIATKALLKNSTDGGLTRFLTHDLPQVPLTGTNSIYRRAGLPTRALIA
jgi:hypothetical protein